MTADTTAEQRRTTTELTCDLSVVEHQLRDLRRQVPQRTAAHLDAALSRVSAALDSLHTQLTTTTTKEA